MYTSLQQLFHLIAAKERKSGEKMNCASTTKLTCQYTETNVFIWKYSTHYLNYMEVYLSIVTSFKQIFHIIVAKEHKTGGIRATVKQKQQQQNCPRL